MNKSTTAFLLILLFLCSFALNSYNNEFDYRLHCDESKKVNFIMNGTQDFKHPILMLQMGRIINTFTGYDNEQDVATASRYASAFMGACLVIAIFFIARRLLTTPFALLATLSVALSPMIVIHAHYLKEDIYFTAPLLFSILFLLKFIESRKRPYGVLFGLFYGLAISAQYKSLMFFVILALLPLLDRSVRIRWYIKELAIFLGISAMVFLIVNYNIFLDITNAYNGFSYEMWHAKHGHVVKAYPLDNLFLFHFKHSLLQGMTPGVVAIACFGLLISICKWKESHLLEKTLFLCIMLFYFAHETSPLKPAPAFMRYMLPIAPMLIVIGWLGVERSYRFTSSRIGRPYGYFLIFMATVALLLYPGYDTLNIEKNLIADTRITISEHLEKLDAKYICELFVLPGYKRDDCIYSAADVDIEAEKKNGLCYVVASSMAYDRYYYGAEMKNQFESVYTRHAGYERLFQYPYVEIKPQHRTYAFSNPTIRIVDICAD